VPTDGHSSLSYDPATNRINTEGWEYDAAGNQTRVRVSSTVWRRMQYDAANRLVAVKSDDGSSSIAAYTYGAGSERLSAYEAGVRTIYMWEEGRVIAEFVEGEASPSSPQWAKNYVYFEDRLLATLTPVTGGELTHYHHPDRLGTRLVTTAVAEAYFYQDTLPFGTANEAESTGNTGRRFTSYDRSPNTGLDYAVNRFYDPLQARFTQVDPVDIEAADLEDPQSFNLYAYCGNDPINSADPDGLWAIGFAIGWGGARGGISLRPFSIFNVGNTALRSWWGTAFWFFQTGNRQGPQPQPHPTPTPSTPVRGEGTSVGSFVGQVVKDTVVGGVKGAYNVFANVPNTINDAVNYGLSWTSIKYRFGRLPEAEYSTNGEAGAGLAVNLIGMFYGVRGASAARTRAGVGSVSARSAVVTQTANTVRRIHGNSRSYPGPTHVYRIDGPMGLWKIGQGIHKLDRMGRSVRAETQVRRLSRQTGQVYRSRILRVFPNKEAALRWERELIRRYTRKHGRRPPGNPVDR
jgi:RHS repeat-associated protein